MLLMDDSLGTQIRAARERRHWDQAELVRRLDAVGVQTSQQAISRWERDQTKPRRATLAALVDLLDFDPAHSSGKVQASELTATTRPLLTGLRFEDLTPEEFEEFSADLADYLFPTSTVHRAGTSGHKQHGIDVEVAHDSGLPTGIQCKREKQFGKQKVKAAIGALTMDVRKCVIFLSRIASPEARREVQKNPDWEIWDSNDLSRKVRQLPRDQAVRLVDTYFPGMRAALLGVVSPGPWRDRSEYYAPISGEGLYSHRWPLVGKTEIVSKLLQCVSDSQSQLTALAGHGGLGKTRILRSLAEEIEGGSAASVSFLTQGSKVTPEDFELLPRTPLVVIIDDAHERSDLTAVIGGVRRTRPAASILLSLRPYGWPALISSARILGIHPSEIDRVDLGDLDFDAATELARYVLPEHDHGLAPYLAKIGTDCPLLIVVGGGLIRQGKIDGSRLERSPEIADEILRAFGNAVSSRPNGDVDPVRREILKALSIMQPFRTDGDDFRIAIAALAELPYDQVSAELASLEDRGILLRRGTALRIVPDLLGDTLLAQAMFDRYRSTSTGYAERVQKVASGEVFDNAIINATRVDWRTNNDHGHSSQAIDPLWQSLEIDFQEGGVARRADILRRLREIAQFQPARCIELGRWAIANPTTADDDSELWGLTASYDPVLREIAPMLQVTSYDIDYLTEAADLLWTLGRLDGRPLNQNPEHPVRILATISEFQRHKPLSVNHNLIISAGRWLTHTDLENTTYSPFDAIKPILATEGESHRSDGQKITFLPFAINPKAVRSLREEALELALQQLDNPDVRQAIRAVSFIEEGLRYPTGSFGRAVNSEETAGWTPLIVNLLNKLSDLIGSTAIDPATLTAIRFACDWHVKYSSTETKQAAEELIDTLPVNREYRVALSLHDGWNHLGLRYDDYEASQRAQNDRFREIADELLDLPIETAVTLIEDRLAADRRGFTERTGHPFPFFRILFKASPKMAIHLCEAVERDPSNVLTEALADAISELALIDLDSTARLAKNLHAKNDTNIDRQIAHALTSGRQQRPAEFEGEGNLLGSLAVSTDSIVRIVLARGMHWVAEPNRKLAARILSSIDFSDSSGIAEEVLGAFTKLHGYLSWSELSEHTRAAFVKQLVLTPSIEDYQIMLFLADRSVDEPDEVLDVLTGRITQSESRGLPYKPLPFSWHKPLAFRDSDRFGSILRKTRDWIASGVQSWQRRQYGADLFRAISGEFDGEVQEVLGEGVASGTPEGVRAVAALLSEAPRTFVWDEVGFVVRILRVADSIDHDFGRQIAGGLESAVIFGMRTGTPGQPFMEDVEQRDRSLEVARRLHPGSMERRFYEALHESGSRGVQREIIADRFDGDDGRRW
jgi:transcriptional regulator with XRE-family HTH domain